MKTLEDVPTIPQEEEDGTYTAFTLTKRFGTANSIHRTHGKRDFDGHHCGLWLY